MTAALFGSLQDPNIKALEDEFDLFIDQDGDLHWDLRRNILYYEGAPIEFNAAFGRSDVFGENSYNKYYNAYLFSNYVQANDSISKYNRDYERETPYKLSNLIAARECGLMIPHTEAGKEIKRPDTIMKPITGGHHARPGSRFEVPVILQDRIVGLNKRLFIIGADQFTFGIATKELDYRDDPNPALFVSDINDGIVFQTRALMRQLGLTFAAADFIDDGHDTWFLEINSGPMFAAFNNVVHGAIAESLRHNL
jgi:hypothetical protein